MHCPPKDQIFAGACFNHWQKTRAESPNKSLTTDIQTQGLAVNSVTRVQGLSPTQAQLLEVSGYEDSHWRKDKAETLELTYNLAQFS